LDLNPNDPDFTANPYACYARLRARQPILRSATLGMTLFFKNEHILALLSDPRLGRTMDHTLPAAEVVARRQAENWQATPHFSRYVRVNLLETEGANHRRVRRIVSRALNPPRIRQLEGTVAAATGELLDGVPRGTEIDFISQLAEPLPVRMIAALIGWPGDDAQRLRPWSAAITRLYETDASEEDARRAEQATAEFAGALSALAQDRARRPQDDLLSALVASEAQAGGLSRDEVIATCMMLLNAGHEATVDGAGNGLLALLQHPEQMSALRANLTAVPRAVEEMLRYDPPLHLFHRYVLEDLTIAGTSLQRGAKVGLLYGSANRDPAAFGEPDAFRVARAPNRHLAFGAATHFCLGAPLARLELTTLFRVLLARCSRITLVDDAPAYRQGLVFRGLQTLPVILDG
jgi:cytochrome P450